MFKDKVFLELYKKINGKFRGKGLTKYSLVRHAKNYALANFRDQYAVVNGCRMLLDAKDCLQLSINEVYEPLETEIIKNEVKNGDVVLDIGANIGYFTLLMSNLVGETGKVFAFEPESYNFGVLGENVKINNRLNVVLEQKAVSNFDGTAELHLSKENTGMHRLNESKHCAGSIPVSVMKLDSYFQNQKFNDSITFVKIDVEGSEFDVLLGMEQILKNNRKIKILLEFIPEHISERGHEPSSVLDFLINHDFILYLLNEQEKRAVLAKKEDILNSSFGRNLFCVRS